MTDEPINPAAEAAEKKKKDRSPAYPAIGLRKAVENLHKLWSGDVKHHSVLVPVAAEAMGYGVKSSTGVSVVSAMKKFGLLVEEGSKDRRTVRISDMGKGILNPNTAMRPQLIRHAALLPTIHADLWKKYGGALPPDSQVKNDLTFDLLFTPVAADALIAEFKDTIQFAGLLETDKVDMPSTEEDGGQLPMFNSPSPQTNIGPQTAAKEAPTMPAPGTTIVPPTTTPTPPSAKQLRMDLDSGPVVVNYPMSEEDFELMVNTLQVWKTKMVKRPQVADSTGYPVRDEEEI